MANATASKFTSSAFSRHVVEGVAGQVVARVELLTRDTAPDGLLLRGLDDLGAGEQTAGGDAGVDEGLVVAATAEGRVVVRLARAACRRTRRSPRCHPSRPARRPAPRSSTRRRRTRRSSSWASRSCRSSGRARSRRAPPGSAGRRTLSTRRGRTPRRPTRAKRTCSGAVRLGHGLRRLEHRGRAAAVVVDAGAGVDGVQVRADHDDVVGVAPRQLGDDVVGRRLTSERVCLERGGETGGGRSSWPTSWVTEVTAMSRSKRRCPASR